MILCWLGFHDIRTITRGATWRVFGIVVASSSYEFTGCARCQGSQPEKPTP